MLRQHNTMSGSHFHLHRVINIWIGACILAYLKVSYVCLQWLVSLALQAPCAEQEYLPA